MQNANSDRQDGRLRPIKRETIYHLTVAYLRDFGEYRRAKSFRNGVSECERSKDKKAYRTLRWRFLKTGFLGAVRHALYKKIAHRTPGGRGADIHITYLGQFLFTSLKLLIFNSLIPPLFDKICANKLIEWNSILLSK